ncbi:MptD family putative ECF transporter S component [Aerococcaceae bacterium DSM 111022]|nr:MptD family putative ECF transporter S component [Aerococcaceae bacterium DSM 111022]
MSLKLKDLINIGIYAAIYFVMVGIAALICVFLIPGYSYVYIPVPTALISGTVFMLAAARIQKFGAITIMATVMGLFFFVSGLFPNAILPAVLFGLLADSIAYIFKYKSKKGLLLSYVVFAFSNIGPIIPMIINPESYAIQLADRGKDASYISAAFSSLLDNTWLIVIIGTIIAAIIGGLFGQKMVRKHFKKAGIV